MAGEVFPLRFGNREVNGAVPNHAASQRLGDRFKKSLL
jgi:hypothetical protein